MKVLHVVPTLSPRFGGPGVSAIGLCKALMNKGVKVEIATTRADRDVSINGLSVHEFPRRFESILPKDFSYSPLLNQWLKDNLNRFNLLHIHAIFTSPTAVACQVARKYNIPYIIQPCGMLAPWSLKRSRLKKTIWMNLFEKRNLDYAAAIHFTSDDEREGGMSLNLTAPNVVMPIGLEINGQVEEKRQGLFNDLFQSFTGRKRILFLSRFHPQKGLDLLIPALGFLARKRDDFVFILAGSGELKFEKEIKCLLARNGLDRITMFAGFVEREKKGSLLNQSDLFVLSSYHENFGLAVAEAMAAGLPIVISDRVNIHHDVQAYNAGLVTGCNIMEIASAIEKVLDNETMRKQMGENGKRLVREKYNWDVIAPQMIKLYEKILSGRKAGPAP